MSYCTVQDLEGYFLGKSFKCGDYLTNGKADMFISQEAAFINARIKGRYDLPITDTNDLLLLKIINEKLVVGTIDDIFREKTEDGKFDRGRNTRKEAMEWLDQIVDGTLVLDGNNAGSVIKFNLETSSGEDAEKRFKDENIEPNVMTRPLPGNFN